MKAMEAAREIDEFLGPIDEANFSWVEKRSLIVAHALLGKDGENMSDYNISFMVIELDRLRALNAELVAALEGVIRVADRKTDEFDAARAAIAKAKGADT